MHKRRKDHEGMMIAADELRRGKRRGLKVNRGKGTIRKRLDIGPEEEE